MRKLREEDRSRFSLGGWQFVEGAWRASGPIPVNQEQRDFYLTQRLPSYPAYKLLNDLNGHNYRLYALYNVELTYYADGAFMGDVVGPARYKRVEAKLKDGCALYVELRSLGADYFLVNSRGWQVPLPTDDFFREHFRLIYSEKSVSVFALEAERSSPVDTTVPP